MWKNYLLPSEEPLLVCAGNRAILQHHRYRQWSGIAGGLRPFLQLTRAVSVALRFQTLHLTACDSSKHGILTADSRWKPPHPKAVEEGNPIIELKGIFLFSPSPKAAAGPSPWVKSCTRSGSSLLIGQRVFFVQVDKVPGRWLLRPGQARSWWPWGNIHRAQC